MQQPSPSTRIWTGVAAGVVTTALLAGVGIGAYRAGQRSDAAIEVTGRVVDGDTARTLVVDDAWRGAWPGPGPGFFVVPLLVVGLLVFFAARRGSRWPGTTPGGTALSPLEYERQLEDWHRRAHAAAPGAAAAPPPADPPAPPAPPS